MPRRTRSPLAACAVGLALAPFCGPAPMALAHDELSITRGREIAGRHCVGCHGREGQVGNTVIVEGVAVPTMSAIANGRLQAPERLQDFILTPHRPMPAIPLELTDVRDLVAYIVSLRQ